MIILDTNVLTELMKRKPDKNVLIWTENQPTMSLFTTTISQAEILYEIELLPPSKRRSALEIEAIAVFEEDFSGRVLAFDSDAARAFALAASQRRKAGRPISQFDAEIVGIARSRGANVATRNVNDFQGCGVKILNPWTP